MAGQTKREGVDETIAEFMDRRRQEVARFGRAAEAAAHQAYGKAIRAGQNLKLGTSGEVMRFGASLIGGARLAPAPAKPPTRPVVSRPAIRARPTLANSAASELAAGARGAQDALTLGAGDHIYAGARAVGDAFQGQDLGRAYKSRMATERARDQYDAKYHAIARTAGQVVGTGVGLAALGPLDAALAGGVRIAQATPMLAREAAVLGGVGAGGGVVGQAATDIQRRRLGTVGDYAGSALGGATGALASARGAPGQAGALGGATTSAAQDVLNGRHVNWRGAGEAALAGGYAAGPAGLAGRQWTEGLRFTNKGKLGEAMGRVRTTANFEKPVPGSRRVDVTPDGSPRKRVTVVDQKLPGDRFAEFKLGRGAKLSTNQRLLYRRDPSKYRVDHFLPRDVGAILAYPFGQLGAQEWLSGEDER